MIKRTFYHTTAWVVETPVRPFLLAMIGLLIVVVLTQPLLMASALGDARSAVCGADQTHSVSKLTRRDEPCVGVDCWMPRNWGARQ